MAGARRVTSPSTNRLSNQHITAAPAHHPATFTATAKGADIQPILIGWPFAKDEIKTNLYPESLKHSGQGFHPVLGRGAVAHHLRQPPRRRDRAPFDDGPRDLGGLDSFERFGEMEGGETVQTQIPGRGGREGARVVAGEDSAKQRVHGSASIVSGSRALSQHRTKREATTLRAYQRTPHGEAETGSWDEEKKAKLE